MRTLCAILLLLLVSGFDVRAIFIGGSGGAEKVGKQATSGQLQREVNSPRLGRLIAASLHLTEDKSKGWKVKYKDMDRYGFGVSGDFPLDVEEAGKVIDRLMLYLNWRRSGKDRISSETAARYGYAEWDIPLTFLSPPDEALRRVLATPVSGDFLGGASLRVVFASLFRQVPANLVFAAEKRPIPTFTGGFQRMSLRTAVFRVLEYTKYKAEVITRPDGTRFISIHD